MAVISVVPFVLKSADQGADDEKAFYRRYAAEISALTARIESFVGEEVVKKKGFCEYPPARRYAMRDLDGDKRDDLLLATTFTMGNGGNHHESHLFVVLTSQPQKVHHLVIGGRAWRDVDRFYEGAMTLFLQFKVWAKSDPECCPSLTTTEEIILENGRVVLKPFDEIKRGPPGP